MSETIVLRIQNKIRKEMTKLEGPVTRHTLGLHWQLRGDVGLMTSLLTLHVKKRPGEVLEGSGQRRGICNVDRSGMCSQVRYVFTSQVYTCCFL